MTALVQAELCLRQAQAASAEVLLRRLLAHYPHGLLHEPLLCGQVLLALALFEQHRVHEARHIMLDAVRQATPELFIRPFLDYGFQSRALLMLVMQNGTLTPESRSFVKEILRIVGQTEGAPPAITKSELLTLIIAASISPREQEVLKLLGEGFSNHEIAARLSISLSTVKTHLQSIYFKLGVAGRMQAVAKAQALKLV